MKGTRDEAIALLDFSFADIEVQVDRANRDHSDLWLGDAARVVFMSYFLELPRIDVVHDVAEAERTCACGTPMVEIGQDVSEQLDIVPMQVRVLRHVRKRYGCPKGDQAPVTAPAPPAPRLLPARQ